jgi:ferredoxin-type protein NapH
MRIKIINIRPMIQMVAAVATNFHLTNFIEGKIYNGKMKTVCVPGLNCYSCPGATGSCPIGSLQAVIGGAKHNVSYYIIGILMLFGTLFGRLICGFLCPFGFIQDLLYKIKIPKLKVIKKIDKPLRWLKYVILVVFVMLLPMVLTNQLGVGAPFFCELICPAGTLEGGIPLLIKNESLRKALGLLFNWKVFLLLIFIISSIFIYRPFCKYICPLGAIYSLFNKFSFYQMNVDKLKCNGCKSCERKCKMNVEITKNINSLECIRCGECKSVCKQGAITSGLTIKPNLIVKK